MSQYHIFKKIPPSTCHSKGDFAHSTEKNISGMEEEKSFFVENIAHYFEFEKWSERARLPLIFKTEPRKSSFGSDL